MFSTTTMPTSTIPTTTNIPKTVNVYLTRGGANGDTPQLALIDDSGVSIASTSDAKVVLNIQSSLGQLKNVVVQGYNSNKAWVTATINRGANAVVLENNGAAANLQTIHVPSESRLLTGANQVYLPAVVPTLSVSNLSISTFGTLATTGNSSKPGTPIFWIQLVF